MKKRILALLLVLLLVFSVALTGCSSNEEAPEGEEPAEENGEEASGDPIKIGYIGPLTGDYSMYGETTKEGAELAAEEINAAGGVLGRDIEIISYDSKGDKTEAVNAYNRLRDRDEMTALVGATFSGTTLSIKEIAKGDGMPMLSPTATHLDVTLDAPNIFRACFTDPYQGATAAVFAADNLGAKKAAVLYNIEDPYSEGLAEAFNEKFQEYGEVTNYEGYTKNDADFKTVLTKIAENDPDVLYLPDYIAKVGVILSQVEEQGLDVVCMGADGWDGIEGDYADVAEGHYFTNHFAKTDESEIVQNFLSNYNEKWGSDPTALSALGYDAVYMMAKAIENAGSTDSQAIVDALAAIEIDGVTGNIVFDENGDPLKSISIIQVIDGKHVLADKVSIQ